MAKKPRDLEQGKAKYTWQKDDVTFQDRVGREVSGDDLAARRRKPKLVEVEDDPFKQSPGGSR